MLSDEGVVDNETSPATTESMTGNASLAGAATDGLAKKLKAQKCKNAPVMTRL